MTATLNGHTVEALLAQLQGVTQHGDKWQACCPGHDDSTASLSVSRGNNGGIVAFCHAGCPIDAILSPIGWTVSDLSPPRELWEGNGAGRQIVATYDYSDENRALLYQAVRYEPKDFRQRRPDGHGGWIHDTKGVRRVLYRLPELLKADLKQPVYIVEGEKDVDRLRSLGLVATCNVGGASKGKCKWLKEYTPVFPGRDVVIIPDNDEPGREHAQKIAESLKAVAHRVCVIELPDLPEHGDVSDWLNAGGDAAKLLTIVNAQVVDNSAFPAIESFTLAELRTRFPTLQRPVIDGLLRHGETANVIANPKVGKSWLAYNLGICVNMGRPWLDRFNTEPGRVLIVDNELHPETIAHRIPIVGDAMGIPYGDYATGIDVWPLRGRLRSLLELAVEFKRIERGYYTLIIFDAKYRFSTNGASENDNAAETQVYNLLDQIAADTNAALALIHHASKGGQSEKRTTDVGAGAGAQSRAADCHLIIREHEEDGLAVLDAAVRSFPPVEPMAIRWEFPLWVPDEWADAGKLKGKLNANEQKQKQRDKEGCDTIISALLAGPATARELRPRTAIGKDRLQRLLDRLEFDSQITAEEIDNRGNKCKQYSVTKSEE